MHSILGLGANHVLFAALIRLVRGAGIEDPDLSSCGACVGFFPLSRVGRYAQFSFGHGDGHGGHDRRPVWL